MHYNNKLSSSQASLALSLSFFEALSNEPRERMHGFFLSQRNTKEREDDLDDFRFSRLRNNDSDKGSH